MRLPWLNKSIVRNIAFIVTAWQSIICTCNNRYTYQVDKKTRLCPFLYLLRQCKNRIEKNVSISLIWCLETKQYDFLSASLLQYLNKKLIYWTLFFKRKRNVYWLKSYFLLSHQSFFELEKNNFHLLSVFSL